VDVSSDSDTLWSSILRARKRSSTRLKRWRVFRVRRALVGAFIGAGVKTDEWKEVGVNRLQVRFGPRRDGRFGLGASVKF
jgi:hypothetical protein